MINRKSDNEESQNRHVLRNSHTVVESSCVASVRIMENKSKLYFTVISTCTGKNWSYAADLRSGQTKSLTLSECEVSETLGNIQNLYADFYVDRSKLSKDGMMLDNSYGTPKIQVGYRLNYGRSQQWYLKIYGTEIHMSDSSMLSAVRTGLESCQQFIAEMKDLHDRHCTKYVHRMQAPNANGHSGSSDGGPG